MVDLNTLYVRVSDYNSCKINFDLENLNTLYVRVSAGKFSLISSRLKYLNTLYVRVSEDFRTKEAREWRFKYTICKGFSGLGG